MIVTYIKGEFLKPDIFYDANYVIELNFKEDALRCVKNRQTGETFTRPLQDFCDVFEKFTTQEQ